MDELHELYQELVLDHSKNPRNFKKILDSNHSAEGFNPLCGDQITVYLKLEKDLIQDISFLGSGCAISKASASLMTTALKNKTTKDAFSFFEKFLQMVTGQNSNNVNLESLGKLQVFKGVKEFPVRVKCASLAWHTLRAAIEKNKGKVSTE